MPFITACDPSPEATVEIVTALEAAGADMVELGIAYSDPLADGPTIQDSYSRVLTGGYTAGDAFEAVRQIRRRSEIPLAGMVSFSIVWKRGMRDFVGEAAKAGLDCLIVPDLPPEEAAELLEEAAAAGLGIVFLVTPTTGKARAATIAEVSSPFIYYVSVVGITGARDSLPPELADGVEALKKTTDKPVVVGFGVSTPEQARAVSRTADGVIVGSAIVKVISAHSEERPKAIAEAVAGFARELAQAVTS